MSRAPGIPNRCKLNIPPAWQALWAATEGLRRAARRRGGQSITWAERMARMTPTQRVEYRAREAVRDRARRAQRKEQAMHGDGSQMMTGFPGAGLEAVAVQTNGGAR